MCVKSLNHGFFRAIGLDDHVNRFSLFFYQRPCFVWEILRPYPAPRSPLSRTRLHPTPGTTLGRIHPLLQLHRRHGAEFGQNVVRNIEYRVTIHLIESNTAAVMARSHPE